MNTHYTSTEELDPAVTLLLLALLAAATLWLTVEPVLAVAARGRL